MDEIIDTLEYLREIMNQAPCGMGLFEIATQRPVFLNDAYYDIVGYSREEYEKVSDNQIGTLMFPHDMPVSDKSQIEFSNNGNVNGYEYRIVRKNKEILWIKLNVSTVVFEGYRYAFATFVDITSEKTAYTQLNMIAENVDSSITIFKVKNGRETLIYANQKFYELVGVKENEYRKHESIFNSMLVSSEEHEAIRKAVTQAINDGRPGVIEHKLTRGDGKTFWLNRRYMAIKQDEPDTYLLISVVTDITQSKLLQIKSDMEHHRYGLVINEIKAAIFEYNYENNVTYMSDSLSGYAVGGCDRDDIISGTCTDIVHPDDVKAYRNFTGKVLSCKDRTETILRMRMKDGSFQWSKLVGLVYRDEEEKLVKIIYVIIDINEEHEKNIMLDTLLNEIPGGVAVFRIGESFVCQYYSDGFAQILGRTRQDIDRHIQNNTLIEDLVAPADYNKFVEYINKRVGRGLSVNYILRYYMKNGELAWLHISASRIREDNGYPVYYCVFTKPSEETELYRSIVEDSAVGVCIAERQTRRVIYMNDAIRDYFYLPSNAGLQGSNISELISEENMLLKDEDVNRLRYDRYTEFNIVLNDRRYFAVKAKALLWNNVDSYILYVSDETGEHEQRIQLEAAINSAEMSVWTYDPYKKLIIQTGDSIKQHGFGKVLENVPESLVENGYVHPDNASEYCSLFNTFTDKKTIVQGDFLVSSPNGGNNWWERVILTPVFDKNGRIINAIGTSINVTERKEKEARYLRQLDSMSELDDENLIAKGRHNITQNKVLFFYGKKNSAIDMPEECTYDEALESLAGLAIKRSKKRAILKMFDRQKLINDYIDDKTEGSIEYKRYVSSGQSFWVVTKYSLIEEPSTNDIIAFLYTYDITDRVIDRQIVSKLSGMEYDALGLLDVKTHQYILRNILSKIEGPTVIGKGDFDKRASERLPLILVPSEREEITRAFKVDNIVKQLNDKTVYTIAYSIQDNGKIFRKKCQFCYLDDSMSTILYCRSDVTDIYQKEQNQLAKTEEALELAREASKAKSDFLSRMSHDIRTPMNTIMNLTRLVREEIDNKEAALEDLKKIETSNQFLLSLVNDILDMSRIEQKQIELNMEAYSYDEFINYIESTFIPLSAQKNINFTISRGKNNVSIITDKVRFNQMCFNLISNAIKYTPDGGSVEFRMIHGDIENGVFPCDIYVADSGIGMSEAFQNKMFEPFAQEGRAFRTVEGTGLGLSIVKEIVELFDGSIDVKSQINKGTTFHIHVTMRVSERVVNDNRHDILDMSVLDGKKILLAEDHPLNQEIARRLLNKAGIQVTIVSNGQEAVDEFNRNNEEYDAVLMDMRMPIMDGLTASQKIRESGHENSETIPIIAMTANAFSEDREKSVRAGMNAHLSKPIDAELMYRTIADCIDKSC